MIGFTVIGGYLGAGKTTLLNHVLRNNNGRRFALLINDFGDINIDGALVESRTDNQINLANGCVCCTLTDGFFESIEQLVHASPPPEHIIVEASGVADVGNLAQYGYTDQLWLDGVVVVADAETVVDSANDKYVAQTVRRQLATADIVVLNKTDLLDRETLAARICWMEREFPGIRLVSAVRADVPVAMLLGIGRRPVAQAVQHHDHADYTSWHLRSDLLMREAAVRTFVERLGPEVLRAKGLVGLVGGGSLEVQVVGRRVEITRTEKVLSPCCQLVALGLQEQMRPDVLDRLAREHLHVGL